VDFSFAPGTCGGDDAQGDGVGWWDEAVLWDLVAVFVDFQTNELESAVGVEQVG
jgi:hypothetical protein